MVLKLYGWPPSPPVQLVMMILHEKQIPYEFIHIDLSKREHKSTEFAEKNPFTQVPIIDDNGFCLYESRAIARYLEEKYPDNGTRLLPVSFNQRILVDQAAWIESYHFNRHATTIYFEVLLQMRFWGREYDRNKVEESTKALLSKLDIYDQILSKQEYLVGDELTLADIYHVPLAVGLVERAHINLTEGRPNVERWFKNLIDRESWHRVKEAFGDKI